MVSFVCVYEAPLSLTHSHEVQAMHLGRGLARPGKLCDSCYIVNRFKHFTPLIVILAIPNFCIFILCG